MARKNLYCLGQDINLTEPQRAALWQVIREIAGMDTGQPRDRNHGRLSLDESLINFQGLFDEDDLSVSAFKQLLADEFGVEPSSIDSVRDDVEIGGYTSPFWTFSRLGTNYFRLAIMGGVNATLAESNDAFKAYLQANAAEWEPSE
jgi:hypothetical protein